MYSFYDNEYNDFKENNESCFIGSLFNMERIIVETNKMRLSSNTFTFINRNIHQIQKYMRKNPYKLIHLEEYV